MANNLLENAVSRYSPRNLRTKTKRNLAFRFLLVTFCVRLLKQALSKNKDHNAIEERGTTLEVQIAVRILKIITSLTSSLLGIADKISFVVQKFKLKNDKSSLIKNDYGLCQLHQTYGDCNDPVNMSDCEKTHEEKKSTESGTSNMPSRSVSFDGCSWYMFYHLGVAKCLVDTYGEDALDDWKFGGSSCGSLVAYALADRVDLNDVKQLAFDMVHEAHIHVGGPMTRMTRIVENGLRNFVHGSASDSISGSRCSDRLAISVTTIRPLRGFLRNTLMTSYRDNQDLINSLLSSCYIPIYYEVPRVLRGSLALDGGFTNNMPREFLHTLKTITVSPRQSSGATIRPPADRQPYPKLFSLFPGSVSDCELLYDHGYHDCKIYLEQFSSDRDADEFTSLPHTTFL